MNDAEKALPETVISSKPQLQLLLAIREMVAYRELFLAFVARDIKVRYKQTALGVIWVLIQPLLMSGVFALLFRRLGAMPNQTSFDATLFFLAGMVPWTTFATGVTHASASLESSANLVSKVYFPRMVVPGAYIAGSTLDYLIACSMLIVMSLVAGKFGIGFILMLPLLLLIQLCFAWGLGVALAALNAQYRDVKYAVPFLLTMGMFVTVLIPRESWGESMSFVMGLNPMSVVVETNRAVLSGGSVDVLGLARAAAIAVVCALVGSTFFRSREAKLVDIL